MSAEGTTVLLTGVGLDGGPDIIRALRADAELRPRVVGVDSDPNPASRYLCDAFHLVPARGEADYLDSVLRIAEAEAARVIYPLPTFDQGLFAGARADLEGRGFAVPVSPERSVRICNDKWLLYEHLRNSLPSLVPDTRRIASTEELAGVVRSFGYPDRPVCIRRPESRGAIGLRVLSGPDSRLRALLERNPSVLLTSLEEVVDSLSRADPFPEYLVQEYLPPPEWDADVLCRDGEPFVVSTRRNLAMEGAGSLDSVLEREEEVDALSRRLVADLGLNAVVNLAYRRDEGGDLKLLEINPRIPSSVLTAMAGGVNLVGLAVRQALGEPLDPIEPAWGGRFLRHYQSVIVDPSGVPVDLGDSRTADVTRS
jgi:carbamoyl-phosphate synthase large subunit